MQPREFGSRIMVGHRSTLRIFQNQKWSNYVLCKMSRGNLARPTLRRARISKQFQFTNAHAAIVTKHDVVEHIDTESLAAFLQPPGNGNIFLAGRWIA